MRVALVYPPFHDRRDRAAYFLAPPLGLLYLAAYLERAGHEVRVFDFILELHAGRIPEDRTIYDRCAAQVLAFDPDVVGISTQCSTNPGSVNIARRLKRSRPSLVVVLGGHDVSFIGRDYLAAFPEIDFTLAGEAELTFTRLIDQLAAAGPLDVPGLTLRDGGTVRSEARDDRVPDLDALLPPAYHLVPPLSEYFHHSQHPVILVDSGRGCSFDCEFCQTSRLTGAKLRYRSVPSLVKELRELADRHGEFEAYFIHDLFTARPAFVRELCSALVDASLPITWQCRCRFDQVTPELLGLMHRAGCRRLLYGVESGSEVTLRRMRKRIRSGGTATTIERVRATVDSGIFPSLSMVVGVPEETAGDLDATMALALELMKLGRVNAFIQLMSPLPGTPLAARTEQRFVYRGEIAPSAFAQGIEFDRGHRLAEDEAIIREHPLVFQSFQSIVPDHGDLELCVDVSIAYCKLLEVFRYTFEALASAHGTGPLALFERYREHARTRLATRTLVGIRDHQIWEAFAAFFEDEHIGDTRLRELFGYERLIQHMAVAEPVPDQDSRVCEDAGRRRFRLRPAAGMVRFDGPPPWQPNDAPVRGRAFLMYMTRDHLRCVHLPPALAEGIDLLGDVGATGSERLVERLYELLEPLVPLNVFEPADPAIEARP